MLTPVSNIAQERLVTEGIQRILAGFRPPPKLTVSQWADRYRVLSPEYSPGGKWDTGEAEYQREIMDAASDPAVETIVVMKPARSGGTQMIDNMIGYWMSQDPGPILVGFPAVEDAEDYSKTHIDTMVRDTPVLRGFIEEDDNKKSKKNTILTKRFPGGILYMIGTKSARGFRQKTIQRVVLDDLDGFDVVAGNEGDQVALAKKRTQTYLFHHRKIVLISTPTTRDLSKIEQAYIASDQRHFFARCPFCQHLQFLRFSNYESQFSYLGTSMLHFDKENLSWVYYECENCKAKIEEKHKRDMVRNGMWKASQPFKGVAGFHFNELVSPFSSWHEIAKDFLEKKRYKEQLRVWVNQTMGETFVEDKTNELNDDDLRKRREQYVNIPSDVLIMTAAVDAQGDRLEALVVGWGEKNESWHIAHYIAYGSPEKEATWRDLDNFFASKFIREDGVPAGIWTDHGINCICIDSGYSAENVYRYVKKHGTRRVFATKGQDGFKQPIIINQKVASKYRAKFALIGVDAIKERLYHRLSLNRDEEGQTPPGFVHFNESCSDEYFEQITAEQKKLVRNSKNGDTRWKWVKKAGRERNEILDLWGYNIAAYTLLAPDMETFKKKLIEKREAQKADDPEEQEQSTTPEKAKQNQQAFDPRKRGNFITRF